MKLHWDALFFAFVMLAIMTNLIVLDVALVRQAKSTQSISTPTPCDSDCEKRVAEIVSKMIPAPASTAVPTVSTRTIQSIASLPTESYIPLGSGSTQSNQWEDISGAESYIDTSKYPNIQTVYFEVAMRIPTKNGIVSARLYNVSDKHPVWFSEVSTDSDTSKLVTTKIQLDKGNKLYRVQMMTSLQYPSIIDFARVKIVTK